jgi:hypothetical protein
MLPFKFSHYIYCGRTEITSDSMPSTFWYDDSANNEILAGSILSFGRAP